MGSTPSVGTIKIRGFLKVVDLSLRFPDIKSEISKHIVSYPAKVVRIPKVWPHVIRNGDVTVKIDCIATQKAHGTLGVAAFSSKDRVSLDQALALLFNYEIKFLKTTPLATSIPDLCNDCNRLRHSFSRSLYKHHIQLSILQRSRIRQ